MKSMKNNTGLPKEMEDIKEGRIFETPPGYFENLTGRFFDNEGHYRVAENKSAKIRQLRPWLIAASVVLIATLALWITFDLQRPTNDLIDLSTLDDYIQSEIMEYDLEALSANLNEIDLYSISEDDANSYEKYIEENLEDFNELIYR